ncbi:uncharacterized protein B0I36DRAFT_389329 [Microdochium trichocladiopsis]|uniref:Uncharacterized protein n=1 Tax=Microdochium trichocladiopsis TaxID=1682393 RepID=A0A9P9BJA3_9PEZI|nr:uncharacterized protein B0I36DRAFT_389329 [Microdochium trichocladiopsis]KAH7014431.1 hypothetical protein B0I36DRAFT_389329 [Microdochium trichocladiopsis]
MQPRLSPARAMRALTLGIFVAARSTTAQSGGSSSSCSYKDASLATTNLCIDTSYVKPAEATFALPPLFTDSVLFYYAIDALGPDEAIQYDITLGNTGLRDSSMVAYWFDYDLEDVALADKTNFTVETAYKVYFTKLPSAATGGGNGGCDGLLGSMCADSIRNRVEYLAFDDVVKPLDKLDDAKQWGNIVGCPVGIERESLNYGGAGDFDKGGIGSDLVVPVAEFVIQYNTNSNLAGLYGKYQIPPPGNSSAAWSRTLRPSRAFREQLDYAAISVIARYQSLDRSIGPQAAKSRKGSKVQVALACAKLPANTKPPPVGPQGGSAVAPRPALWAVLLGYAMAVLWLSIPR